MPAPVPNIATSRTTGRIPLAVFFDATATTTDLANDFHDPLYEWSFGMTDAGDFANGSPSQPKKNMATGPLAACVFEEAGEYLVTLRVSDGTLSATETVVITASAWPDNADTVYIGNVEPVPGQNGVPLGATCVESDDFDAMIAAHTATNKRLLFTNGDSFASSETGAINETGPILIGSYGAGDIPTITSSSVDGVVQFTTGASDIRLMDFRITGAGADDTGRAIKVASTCDAEKITILGVEVDDIGAGIVVSDGGSLIDSVVQECEITTIHAASGGVGFYGKAVTSAFLGNVIGPFATTAEHLLRIQPGQKVVASHNTLTTPGDSGKLCLTVRAGEHATAGDPDPVNDTQYVYLSDNKLIYPRGSATGAQTLQISPASNTQNNWIADVIAERNWIQNRAATATSSSGVIVSASRVTIRNNAIDMSDSPAGMVGVSVFYTNTEGSPVPDDVQVLNNTINSANGEGAFVGVLIDDEPTATVAINNLGYAPESASRDMVSGTGTSPGTQTPNSSDAQILTDPQFIGPLTSISGFKIAAASYATDDGTATGVPVSALDNDLFNGFDLTGDNRIGAAGPASQFSYRSVP